MDFHIGNKTLTRNSEPYLVAEIGLNHNADLEIGKRTIEKAKESGAHAVKFQTYITEEFIDSKNPEVKFLFDIFKQYELSESLHKEFQKTAMDLGLDFFLLLFVIPQWIYYRISMFPFIKLLRVTLSTYPC